jgi:hypothetical protein
VGSTRGRACTVERHRTVVVKPWDPTRSQDQDQKLICARPACRRFSREVGLRHVSIRTIVRSICLRKNALLAASRLHGFTASRLHGFTALSVVLYPRSTIEDVARMFMFHRRTSSNTVST